MASNGGTEHANEYGDGMECTVDPGDEMTDADIDELVQELREWREDAELNQSQLVERYRTALQQIAAMKYEADPQAPRIAREALR